MLTSPMDVLIAFPVRKTSAQKAAFREAVGVYAEKLGYSVTIEQGRFGARNVILGDPEKAEYLVTAHYDTCARLPVPNLITPCNFWPFLGYQILLTLALLVPPFLAGCLLGLILRDSGLAGTIAYCLLWAELILMLFGPQNPTNANDNTSGVVTLLEIARTLPEKHRSKVCFVLFDLEEAGLIGSASYRNSHKKASDCQIVLNLDCVGEGDHLRFFPTKKLKKDRKKLTALYKACGHFGKKNILVHEKGFSYYPSDQKNFPYGVGICALKKSRAGLYLDRIHTGKDTVLEPTNVNLLSAALITYISQTEAEHIHQ